MPDSIQPPIRSHRKCAEPVPLTGIDWIVVNLVWRAEGESAICAAHKHDVGRASPAGHHAVQHVNVVVSRAAGVVNREEGLANYAAGINRPKIQQAATKVNSGVSVKRGCLASDLRVARAHAAKSCASGPTTNKHVAVGIYIKGPPFGRVRNNHRALPRNAAVCGALKCRAGESAVSTVVCLVLEPMPRSVSLIDRQPCLVAARASVG